MAKLIYSNIKWQAKDYWHTFLLLVFILLFALPIFLWISSILLSLLVGLMVLVYYYLSYFHKRLRFFELYEDRIEIWGKLWNSTREVFPLDDFFQVRFEDQFNMHDQPFQMDIDEILLYPKPNIQSKLINDAWIEIWIPDAFQRKEKIIQILRAFQQKEVEVVIKTSHEIIQRQLNLKNWDGS